MESHPQAGESSPLRAPPPPPSESSTATQLDHELAGPGHPVLHDAQEKLHIQIQEAKARLNVQLRETANELRKTRRAREAAGAELRAQQLALERLDQRLQESAADQKRVSTHTQALEASICELERAAKINEALTRTKQERAAELQRQLAAASSMLMLAERAKEVEMGELAATKRAAYAADERASREASQREGQDALAERLHADLQQLQANAAQHDAHRRQCCAAADAAASDGAELAVAAEEAQAGIKSLLRQWDDALRRLHCRDADLARAHDAGRRLTEKQAALQATISRYHKDAQAQGQENEGRGAALRRQAAYAERLAAQVSAAERQGATSAAAAQEANHLAAAIRGQLEAAAAEGKGTERDRDDLDRQRELVGEEIQRLEDQNLEQLSEKLGADQSARRVAEDIRRAAAAARGKAGDLAAGRQRLEGALRDLEAEEGRNVELATELQRAEGILAARCAEVDTVDQALRGMQRGIERATRQAQAADRERLRRAEGGQEEDAGPLENVAANLQRDLASTQTRAAELRQLWAEAQRQLLKEHHTQAAAAQAHAEAHARAGAARQECGHLEQM